MAGDGKTVMLGVQDEREWAVFCDRILDDAALATDERFASNSRRHRHRDALRMLILERFGGATAADLVARLDAAHIACARLHAMDAVWAHPKLAARDRWREVDTPVGPVAALLPPGRNDRFECRMGDVPALGQHAGAILAGIGLAPDAVATMRRTGAV